MRGEHRFTNANKAQPRSFIGFTTGYRGTAYGANFGFGQGRVDIYIDKGDWDWNKHLFDRLSEQKDPIESAFGESLEWQRLDERRACRIAAVTQASIDDDEEALDATRAWMVDHLLKFKQVFGPRLSQMLP